MEQEHLILIALVLIVVFMINNKCNCNKAEKFGLEGEGLMAQHIRYGNNPYEAMAQYVKPGTGRIHVQHIRQQNDNKQPLTSMAQHIRYGEGCGTPGFCENGMAQRVNMNHDFQARLKNHIRNDSRENMLSSIMTGCGDK